MKETLEGNPSFGTADRERVADVRATELAHGFVRAFAAALRDGVPGNVLAEQASFSGGGSVSATVNTVDVRRARLERQLEEAERAADRAVKLSVASKRDSLTARYDKEAKAALDQADKAAEGLRKLEQDAALPAPAPRELSAYVDVLRTAATALVASPRISQGARQALNTVVPTFRMDRQPDGEWIAEAYVRLNVGSGVADLGPIRWSVGFGGRGETRVRAVAELPEGAQLESPLVLGRRLEATGRVGVSGVRILRNAPFRQLPYVVLHGLGAPLPDWVEGRWRDDAFVKWVTGIYANPDFDWPSRRWSQVAELRQLVVHLAAESGGEITSADVRAAAPVPRSRWVLMCAVPAPEGRWNKAKSPDWGPSVVPVRPARAVRVRGAKSLICRCGNPVRVVAHVPEVPRDMLCECGLMPDAAKFDMPEDLLFPEEYSALMLSKDACIAEITRRTEKRFAKLTPTMVQVLAMEDLLSRGATMAEFGGSRGGLSATLGDMEAMGLLYFEQPGPTPTKYWYFTDAGRERAAAQRRASVRPSDPE